MAPGAPLVANGAPEGALAKPEMGRAPPPQSTECRGTQPRPPPTCGCSSSSVFPLLDSSLASPPSVLTAICPRLLASPGSNSGFPVSVSPSPMDPNRNRRPRRHRPQQQTRTRRRVHLTVCWCKQGHASRARRFTNRAWPASPQSASGGCSSRTRTVPFAWGSRRGPPLRSYGSARISFPKLSWRNNRGKLAVIEQGRIYDAYSSISCV